MNPHANQAYHKGLMYAKQGRFTEAKAFLNEALRHDPEHLDAQNVLGKVHLHLGNLAEAKSCWQRILALDANNSSARQCLNTIKRTEWVCQLRQYLVLALLLIGIIVGGYSLWTLQIDQKLVQAISFASEFPGKLRAQPISSPILSAADAPPHLKAEGTDVGSAEAPATAAFPDADAAPPEEKSAAPKEEPVTVSYGEAVPNQVTEAEEFPPLPVIITTTDVNQVYDRSLALFRSGDPSAAIPGFQAILAAGVSSPLLDNAQFWLGECYAAQSRYTAALEALQKVATLPDGNKAHDAQIRIRKIKRLMQRSAQ